MACALPAEQGVPLSRWSATELAREAVARGIVEQISGVTVWRWGCGSARISGACDLSVGGLTAWG